MGFDRGGARVGNSGDRRARFRAPSPGASLWSANQQLRSVEAGRHGGRRRRLDLRAMRRRGAAFGSPGGAEDGGPRARASALHLETARAPPQPERTCLPGGLRPGVIRTSSYLKLEPINLVNTTSSSLSALPLIIPT